jgi:hypothetical protein
MGKGKRARAASNAARHPNTTAKQMIRERNQIADSINAVKPAHRG